MSEPCPLRRVPIEEVEPFVNCVPLYDVAAEAGRLTDLQWISEVPQHGVVSRPEEFDWVALPSPYRASKELFVAQVVGDSMDRLIPNGAWCLWLRKPQGCLIGNVVLAQYREAHDPDPTGHYALGVYESTRQVGEDGSSQLRRIALRPASSQPDVAPIVVEGEEAGELSIVAVLVDVLGSPTGWRAEPHVVRRATQHGDGA